MGLPALGYVLIQPVPKPMRLFHPCDAWGEVICCACCECCECERGGVTFIEVPCDNSGESCCACCVFLAGLNECVEGSGQVLEFFETERIRFGGGPEISSPVGFYRRSQMHIDYLKLSFLVLQGREVEYSNPDRKPTVFIVRFNLKRGAESLPSFGGWLNDLF